MEANDHGCPQRISRDHFCPGMKRFTQTAQLCERTCCPRVMHNIVHRNADGHQVNRAFVKGFVKPYARRVVVQHTGKQRCTQTDRSDHRGTGGVFSGPMQPLVRGIVATVLQYCTVQQPFVVCNQRGGTRPFVLHHGTQCTHVKVLVAITQARQEGITLEQCHGISAMAREPMLHLLLDHHTALAGLPCQIADNTETQVQQILFHNARFVQLCNDQIVESASQLLETDR